MALLCSLWELALSFKSRPYVIYPFIRIIGLMLPIWFVYISVAIRLKRCLLLFREVVSERREEKTTGI